MQATLPASVLTTKLFFPSFCPVFVSRPRLIERVQAGLQGSLILISAPAGSGKSTLLSEWRAGPGVGYPATWLSLDGLDNDLVRFFFYLAAALDSIQPGLMQKMQPLLQTSEILDSEVVLTQLVNNLSTTSHPFLLVLDDYHLIENPAIQQVLIFLLEHMPPAMHLALLTRSDPPLPLARLRAQGRLTEIRAADLSFTLEEAAQFLNQMMGLNLSPPQIAALESRTEGWIAGLQLAALSMQGRQDTTDFINAFTGNHHFIVDYLAEEVLNRQPESVRAFLLMTSILERLSGSLCAALTERSDEQATLEYLASTNLFTISLDNERQWYRYHHLFRDLLSHRLHTQYPDRIADLHRRAASWFESRMLIVEAIEHALLIPDYPGVRSLMRDYFNDWMRAENHARIFRWFANFPHDFLRREPWLCLVYAWLLWGRGKIENTVQYLDYAQWALEHPDAGVFIENDDPEYIGMPAEILAFRALIAGRRQNPEMIIDLASRSLSRVEQSPGMTAKHAGVVRGIAHLGLQVAYRELGKMDKAIEESLIALEQAKAGGESGTIVSAFQNLGVLLLGQGQFQQALQIYQDGLSFAETHGLSHVFAFGLLNLRLADLYYYWNRLEQAERSLQLGLDKVESGGNTWAIVYGQLLFAQIKFALGDAPTAFRKIADLSRMMPKIVGAYFEEELLCYLALTKVRLGEIDETLNQWLQAHPFVLTLESYSTQVERMLYRMHVQISMGQMEQAIERLSILETVTSQRGNRLWLLESLILKSMVWHLKKDVQQALACLRQALELAESFDCVRPFLNQGSSIQDLLRFSYTQGIAPDFTSQILAASRGSTSSTGPAPQPLIVPLSKREIELLNLIKLGRTNKEIADELVISIGTVKRHTVNIFTKLDVKNRTEAVAKAQIYHLL